jgi:predicted nucleotidyltransferase
MNVAGYQDAFDAALTVQIENGLNVRVVSLPGLAVLKLFAWADRGSSDARDALDLATLLHTYADAGNDDRLYGDEIDAMEAVDFKMELAGARLLGRDARRVAAEDTLTRMSEMLRGPQQWMRLSADMARARSRLEDASSEAEELLKQFQEGLVGH